MAARVTVMAENAHIVDLIRIMSPEKGHRQIPVVNSENRLTGMVYQASLICAMYNEWPEFPKSKPVKLAFVGLGLSFKPKPS